MILYSITNPTTLRHLLCLARMIFHNLILDPLPMLLLKNRCAITHKLELLPRL